ncbi:energy transducer TonB [Oecophyllibacter saccharovorans]|nr:energy transducer TonB [Oecophyllibacter saccharovorans]
MLPPSYSTPSPSDPPDPRAGFYSRGADWDDGRAARDGLRAQAILPRDGEAGAERHFEHVGVGVSVLAHLGLVALLLWPAGEMPPPPPPAPQVEMVFDSAAVPAQQGTGQPHAAQKSPSPRPPAPQETPEPPAPQPPTPKPPEPPPPAPPPPRPVRATPKPVHNQPKAQVHQQAELHEKGEVAPKPKTHPKTEPAKQQADVKAPEKHVEKTSEKSTTSHTTQAHETKNTQADSNSLLATLDSFRSSEKQSRPARAAANPHSGGSPKGGGSPDSDTRALSGGEQRAIGGSVRRCYEEDTAAKNYASFTAHLIVTVDSSGEARLATFAPETAARMARDPSYRVLAERARSAVLSPTCSRLPVPRRLLGQTRQFRFVFRP